MGAVSSGGIETRCEPPPDRDGTTWHGQSLLPLQAGNLLHRTKGSSALVGFYLGRPWWFGGVPETRQQIASALAQPFGCKPLQPYLAVDGGGPLAGRLGVESDIPAAA